jgi:hypothetical protein
MADALHTLLKYIVDQPLMHEESQEAQRDASAVQDIDAEISKIGADERADAGRLAPAFAHGLRAATRGPLKVDDTTPEGNAIADAFARFLVTPNLATSQSVPVSDGHFAYTFEVNWPRLREIAQRAGIDLDRALASDQNDE